MIKTPKKASKEALSKLIEKCRKGWEEMNAAYYGEQCSLVSKLLESAGVRNQYDGGFEFERELSSRIGPVEANGIKEFIDTMVLFGCTDQEIEEAVGKHLIEVGE